MGRRRLRTGRSPSTRTGSAEIDRPAAESRFGQRPGGGIANARRVEPKSPAEANAPTPAVKPWCVGGGGAGGHEHEGGEDDDRRAGAHRATVVDRRRVG
jgi:hypothetical protein